MSVQGLEGGTPFISNVVRTPVVAPVQPAPTTGVPAGASLTQVENAAKNDTSRATKPVASTELPPEAAIQSAVDIRQGLVNNTTVTFVKIEGVNDGDVAYTIPLGYEEYTKEAGVSDEKPAQVRYSI